MSKNVSLCIILLYFCCFIFRISCYFLFLQFSVHWLFKKLEAGIWIDNKKVRIRGSSTFQVLPSFWSIKRVGHNNSQTLYSSCTSEYSKNKKITQQVSTFPLVWKGNRMSRTLKGIKETNSSLKIPLNYDIGCSCSIFRPTHDRKQDTH